MNIHANLSGSNPVVYGRNLAIASVAATTELSLRNA